MIMVALIKHGARTIPAKDLGVMRLASRISDLRQRGIDITDDWLTITNRYGEKCRVKRYTLTEEDKA